jgi:acetolactate synthase I/II/III large subunit
MRDAGVRRGRAQCAPGAHPGPHLRRPVAVYAEAERRGSRNKFLPVDRDPRGPVYLTGAREVMEETTPAAFDPDIFRPVPPAPLPDSGVAEIVSALAQTKRPRVVTNYLGCNPQAVAELVRLCERLGVGVLKSVPTWMNHPHDATMYQGYHWHHPRPERAARRADVVLVVDSDVPWMPAFKRPDAAALVLHVDVWLERL